MSKQITYEDLQGNFILVLYLIWRHLGLPDPTPIQKDIAHYLQHGPSKLMVMAFRGVGKSWITSAFVIWYLMQNPNANVVVVSANSDRATKFTNFVLRLIMEIPEFEHLRPRRGQRSSSTGFDIGIGSASHTQSCTSVGITGNMTGDRADLIIFDDIEIPNNSETAAQREKIADRSREASALLKPGGRIVYLGTPQCQDSIYLGLPERGFDLRIWPILFPTQSQLAAYEGWLAPMLDEALHENRELTGKSTEPSRFTLEDIEERRRDYGPPGFALQFMLDTSLSDVDKYPLKQADLLVFPLDIHQAPSRLVYAPTAENEEREIRNIGMRGDRIFKAVQLQRDGESPFKDYGLKLMAIDPSGRGADETGYAVVAGSDGLIYTLDVGGVKGVQEEHLRTLCEIAEKYEVNVIACEPNYGGGMFTVALQQALDKYGYQCSVRDAEWARGNKNQRIIETLRPAMGSHKIVMDRGMFERDYRSVQHLPETDGRHYRFFHQLTNLTEEKGSLRHDDRVEALAIAVNELKREVGINPERLREQRDQTAFQDELRNSMARVNRTRRVGPPNMAPRA